MILERQEPNVFGHVPEANSERTTLLQSLRDIALNGVTNIHHQSNSRHSSYLARSWQMCFRIQMN
jgi:hypothetical protein